MALSRALSDPTCPLLHLDVSHNDILPSGAKALVTALVTNQRLEALGAEPTQPTHSSPLVGNPCGRMALFCSSGGHL